MTEFTADGIDRTTTLKVSGLTCGHCVAHVTEELEALDGVKNVSVLLNKGGQSTVTVLSDIRLDDAALAEAIDEAGDSNADQVRHGRASSVSSVRRLLEAVATAEAASKAAR